MIYCTGWEKLLLLNMSMLESTLSFFPVIVWWDMAVSFKELVWDQVSCTSLCVL